MILLVDINASTEIGEIKVMVEVEFLAHSSP
jgi:hypothetical protein